MRCPQERPAKPEVFCPSYDSYAELNLSQRPPVPPSTSTTYQPLPGVIEQNDAFISALRAAHLVLYERFKQYGQASDMSYLNIVLNLSLARCARMVRGI